jgi:hypothetical protein
MHRGLAFALPLLIVLAVLALAFRCPLVPYLNMAFGASFVLYALDRPDRKSLLLVLAISISLYLLRFFLDNAAGFASPLAFLGMATLASAGIAIGTATTDERRRRIRRFCHLGALPFLALIAGVSVAHTARWLPVTYDSHLYVVDSTFGFQASFVIGQLFAAFHG